MYLLFQLKFSGMSGPSYGTRYKINAKETFFDYNFSENNKTYHTFDRVAPAVQILIDGRVFWEKLKSLRIQVIKY